MTHIGSLPAGTRGFDCNTTVGISIARKFVAAGFRFAVRYVRREQRHDFDITAGELAGLLEAGLGVMLVQHVAPPAWMPYAGLGHVYGTRAAEEAQLVGYPAGAVLWCDLEGVSARAEASDVIGYCNSWWRAVESAGYDPGLYVGDGPGLTGRELYHRLRFARYWAAYNLNRDQYPVVRGVQMQQRPYPGVDARVPGVPFQYDVDTIMRDARDSTPALLLP